MKFYHYSKMEPHSQRAQAILAKYPHVRSLFGHTPSTALFTVALVFAQVAIAYLLRNSAWWVILVASYSVGALISHGLWSLIHECTHNLVFKRPLPNSLLQIFANLPHLLPSAISFRKYHIIHHRSQGDVNFDSDLPSEFEMKLIGNSTFGKAMWLLFYFVFQPVRVFFLKKINLLDKMTFVNLIASLAFTYAIYSFMGGTALAYLFLSSMFSVGLHPVGARWIQEHFLVKAPQETYSYYGSLNATAFNVGYHNEHHDFMYVPWSRLPQVKKMAPEFYESLHYHNSWSKLLWKFLTDKNLGLNSRSVRAPQPLKASDYVEPQQPVEAQL